MSFNLLTSQYKKGIWLMINDNYTMGDPIFIEFGDDHIAHFEISDTTGNGILEKKCVYRELLSKIKYQQINDQRIRLYSMGNKHTVISAAKSITELTEFATDCERIAPSITDLTKEEIERLEFFAEWHHEKINIVFNKDLDCLAIQEANKRLKTEGRKLILENLDGTNFVAIYDHGQRQNLIPIRDISRERITLYGFPEEPYQITGISI